MSVDRSTPRSLAILAVICAAPIAANAQAPSYAVHGETISGTIASVENVNHLFVADDRGYTDDVTLRAGAAVFSNGLRLEPGVRVTVVGSAAGRTFLATRIATSGRSYAADASAAAANPAPAYPVPMPVYYPAPVYYAYAPPIYSPFYGSSRFFFGFSRFNYGFHRGFGPFFGSSRGFRPRSVGVFVHVR